MVDREITAPASPATGRGRGCEPSRVFLAILHQPLGHQVLDGVLHLPGYLAIVGVLLRLVDNYIPMDGKIRQIINALWVQRDDWQRASRDGPARRTQGGARSRDRPEVRDRVQSGLPERQTDDVWLPVECFLPALSPLPKARPYVRDVQPQRLADRDEREAVVAVVGGEPPLDLREEPAATTVRREGVALENPDRVLEHRDEQTFLGPQRVVRPARVAEQGVRVPIRTVEHGGVVAAHDGRRNPGFFVRVLARVVLRLT